MSESVSGSAAAASALTGASLYGLLTGTDYSVAFGAFVGAVSYVATAADLTLPRRTAYFVVSYFAGVRIRAGGLDARQHHALQRQASGCSRRGSAFCAGH